MDNPKGKLQEYCQSKSLPFPTYETVHVAGLPHMPQFQSTVTVLVNGENRRYTGDLANNKKACEGSAAQVAMNAVTQHRQAAKTVYTGTKIRILVDIENQQKILDDIMEYIDIPKSNVEIIVFVTENSPLSKLNLKEIGQSPCDTKWTDDKIRVKKIHSVRADAADTFMIFEAGRMVEVAKQLTTCSASELDGSQPCRYLILSQDHFAKTLEECFVLYGFDAKMASNIETILSFL